MKFIKSNIVIKIISIYFLLLFCFCFSACSGSNPDYESFLTGNGKLLYFIKPVDFNGDNADAKIDISFQAIDTATGFCNFTVIMKNDNPFKVTGAQFNTDKKTAVTLFDIERLFKEGDNSRFTARFKFDEFRKLFNSKKINFTIVTDSNTEYRFSAGEKFYGILADLSKDI